MKNITIALLFMTPILGSCSKDSFDPDAGFLQKYGEKTTSGNGQECLRVKLYMNGETVGDGGYGVSDPSYVDYFPNDSVEWVWGGSNTVAKGTKIDDAGSFKIEAGNQIDEEYYSGTTSHLNSKICVYPMMQYKGEDILLTDIEEMVFRVSKDDVIRFECDRTGLPDDAEVGFGSIDKDYRTWEYSEIVEGNGTSESYKYGPYWLMYLNFTMSPDAKKPGK